MINRIDGFKCDLLTYEILDITNLELLGIFKNWLILYYTFKFTNFAKKQRTSKFLKVIFQSNQSYFMVFSSI